MREIFWFQQEKHLSLDSQPSPNTDSGFMFVTSLKQFLKHEKSYTTMHTFTTHTTPPIEQLGVTQTSAADSTFSHIVLSTNFALQEIGKSKLG